MTLKFTIPETWNELTLAQQLHAYSLIMGESRMLLDPQEVMPFKRILLFKCLSDITEEQFQLWRQDCIQEYPDDPEGGQLAFLTELEEAMSSCNGLFDITTEIDAESGQERTYYSVKLGLTACPWPVLTLTKKSGKKKHYYAPSDGLENLTFLELCVTFSLFEQFIQDYDEDVLSELLAVLYRLSKPETKENKRSGYHGDRRQPYLHHESLVPARAKKMAHLPMPVRQLLLFWFASCRQSIIERFPELFTPADSQQAGGSKYGWGATLMALAESLTNLDKVSSQPATDALVYLDYVNEQARQRERERQLQALKA